MNAFNQLAVLPGFRGLSDLAWRLFGVNVALVSPDGERAIIFDVDNRTQPFCSALGEGGAGRALCAMCDRNRFLEARRDSKSLRYRCHAGLTEFIVPVVRDGEAIALLQCGLVHDPATTETEWRTARRDLVAAGIDSRPLRRPFWRNRVLTPDRQSDLLALMELIAQRLAHSDEQPLGAEPGRMPMQLGRAVTFIEVHLAERLTLPIIARAAGVSTRGLTRIFKAEIGSSVVQFILRRRISRACHLLRGTDHTCAEIAFETGFGSVQHFNRIFRRLEQVSPRLWRQRSRAHGTLRPELQISARDAILRSGENSFESSRKLNSAPRSLECSR